MDLLSYATERCNDVSLCFDAIVKPQVLCLILLLIMYVTTLTIVRLQCFGFYPWVENTI